MMLEASERVSHVFSHVAGAAWQWMGGFIHESIQLTACTPTVNARYCVEFFPRRLISLGVDHPL